MKISFKKKEGGSKLGNIIKTVAPVIGKAIGIPPAITSGVLGKPGLGKVGAVAVATKSDSEIKNKEESKVGSAGAFALFTCGHFMPIWLQLALFSYLVPTFFFTIKNHLKYVKNWFSFK